MPRSFEDPQKGSVKTQAEIYCLSDEISHRGKVQFKKKYIANHVISYVRLIFSDAQRFSYFLLILLSMSLNKEVR